MRDQVFISYSHKDSRWLDKLQTHLKPFERIHKIRVWDDRDIGKGSKWSEEIKRALDEAKVAVLLVSPNYLASDFIVEQELSPLLKAAESEGLKILWVAVSASAYAETALNDYQAVNNPARPLDDLKAAKLNEELVKICEAIKEALKTDAGEDEENEAVFIRNGRTPVQNGETTHENSKPPVSTTISVADTSASFWTDFGQEYKSFHQAESSGATYRPDVLLVFCSCGEACLAWDELPEEVLAAAKIDIDVLSVEYPEHNNSNRKVRVAAGALRTLLLTTFAPYRHLFFVGRNCEAIIRQLLLDDDEEVPESPTGRMQYDSSLTYRSRCIIIVPTEQRRQSAGNEKVVGAFEAHLARNDSMGLPTPETLHAPHAYLPKSEGVGPRGNGRPGGRRGLPGALAALIAERLSPFRTYQVVAIARHTVARTGAMDSHVQRFFGDVETKTPTGAGQSSGFSQAALLRMLTGGRRDASGQRLLIITGSAGMGKSVLLRTAARRMAMALLRGDRHTPVPLFFTLSQFKIDASDPDPERIWRLLCDEWASWVNDLLSSHASEDEQLRPELITVDYAWVCERLRRLPTTLLFDAVDEFMLKHPQLSLTDFAALLRLLQSRFGENQQFSIVAGIRSSARDVTLITDSESQVMTLRDMAIEEAAEIFPSAMNLVKSTTDPAVQKLLLTPLILSELNKTGLRLEPDAYLNRAALIQAALSAIIASLKRVWHGKVYSTSAWLDALSLIAWYYFRDLRGDIEDGEVAEYAARTIDEWMGEPNSAAEMEVVDNYRILLDPIARRTLLRRSVFFPVRDNSYRLKHKEWSDYLVSRYAMLCIRHSNLDDLSVRALNHDIYIMAGQQLRESDTERRNVRNLVQRASTGGRFLILGNFAQMLGASFAPLTNDVLGDEILDKLHMFPNVVRFAMLSALGSRVLLADKRDEWHKHIRPTLLESLNKYAHAADENALVRSLSWCYLRAMLSTSAPWPGLWSNEAQTIDTLSVIASKAGDGFAVDERQHSIQTAFMRIQSYALEIPSRVISTIHYLYPLALAYNQEVDLERTVVAELPMLLSDTELDAVYNSHAVAEVSAIWNRCKELYANALLRTPIAERTL